MGHPLLPGIFIYVKVNKLSTHYYWIVAAMGIGYLLYLLNFAIVTGDPFEGIAAQKSYFKSPSLGNLLRPLKVVEEFFLLNETAIPHVLLLNRVFFLISIAGLALLWRTEKLYFFMMLPAVLIPAMVSFFISFMRFTLLMLPLHWAFAGWMVQLKARNRMWINVVIILVLNILQFIILWSHVNLQNMA